MKLKKNKYLILGIVIMIGIVIYSYCSYYDEKFSYAKDYYKIEEMCHKENNINNQICDMFKENGDINKEKLNQYILDNDPKKIKSSLDVITVTSEIVEFSFFSILQIFSPLIICIVVIGTLHDEFSSGNFKNKFLREDYKKYLKKQYLIVHKAALLMPFSLILVFIFACFFTNFNFDTSLVFKNSAVYSEWKYNNFFLYGLTVCIIQYLISLLYANIGIISIKNNKNKLVSIVMSYIIFIIVYIFIYIVLYVFIINKFLGFKELTEYFNIIGYWFFNTDIKLIWIIMLSFIFQFISFIWLYIIYKNKEKLVLSYEKQIS